MTNFTSKLHPTTETKQEDITIFAQKSAEIFTQMLILAVYVDMIQVYRSMQVKNIALQILWMAIAVSTKLPDQKTIPE